MKTYNRFFTILFFYLCFVLNIYASPPELNTTNLSTSTTDIEAIQKIVPSDTGGYSFGRQIAISGEYAIVRADFRAFILKKDSNGTWSEVQKMSHAGVKSVAIDGDYAVVCYLATLDSMAIYQKQGDGSWTKIQNIASNDVASNDLFGSSVAISGDYIVVGAYLEDENATGGDTQSNAGSAYIFKNDGSGTWSQVQKIVASDRVSQDNFGYSVAISGEYIAIGAIGEEEDESGNNTVYDAGSVYIFKKQSNDTWSQVQKIVTSDRSSDDNFGRSLSLDGDYLISGSANIAPNGRGGAYIFKKDSNGTWSQLQKLVSDDIQDYDYFGETAFLNGEYAVIGAYQHDYNETGGDQKDDAGAAYIFKKDSNDNWNQIKKIVATDREVSDKFGNGVLISENYVMVGAYNDDSGIGSAYIFSMPQTTIELQVAENKTHVVDLNATDAESEDITFSISGTDAAYFDINATTGLLEFKSAPDFETPQDNNQDNIYEVSVTVTDTSSSATTTALTVEVTNVEGLNLESISDVSKTEDDDAFLVTLNATYDGSGSITYSAASSNTNIATVSISNNNLTITPVTNANGSVTIEVNATADSQSDTKTFTLSISAVNDAPNFDATATTDFSGEIKALQKIVASDRNTNDHFSNPVAINGNWAIIGAYEEDDDANGANTLSDAGSAYLFKRGSNGQWTQIQKIVASDRAANNWFGYAVDIEGDYAVVGAALNDGYMGAVYIFKKDSNDNWTEIQKIVAGETGGNVFGSSVAIQGDYIIVGAWRNSTDADGNNNLSYAGAAYIFKNDGSDNWSKIQKIVASDRATNDYFGVSVDIDGDFALIGANNKNAAYLFKNDGSDNWSQHQKLTGLDTNSGDNFGFSVSMSGAYAIIGAGGEDENVAGGETLSGAGSAYIFKNDGSGNWSQLQKIVASDRAGDDQFGRSVAINGDYLLIGAYNEDENAVGEETLSNAGSAYVFKKESNGNWSQIKKLVASDRNSDDYFGLTVAISSDYALVGATNEDDNVNGSEPLNNAGSAYFFNLNPSKIEVEVEEGQTAVVDLNATDLEGDSVIFSISGSDASHFNLNASSGLVTFTSAPDFANPSDTNGDNIYELNVTVTDSHSAATTVPMEVTVIDVNQAPVLDAIGNITKNEDDSNFTLILNATDPDGDIITYSATSSNTDIATVSINENNLTVTPIENANGSVTIEVNATANGQSDTQTFTLTIEAQNDAPILDMSPFTSQTSQNYVEVSKLIASDGATGNEFGESVSISGEYAIIGSQCDRLGAYPNRCHGSAYIFKKGSDGVFSEMTKFTIGTSEKYFGRYVTINDEYAFSNSSGNGEYIYKKDANGVFQYHSHINVGAMSIETSGDYVAFGTTSGVKIYKKDTNGNLQYLTNVIGADTETSGDYFGDSVWMNGNYLVVGAWGDDDNGSRSGSVYVFEKDENDTFTEKQKLWPSDPGPVIEFSKSSLCISGDYIAVGTYNNGGEAVYIFKKDANGVFQEIQKLTALDGQGGDLFSISVKMYGEYLITGAYSDNNNVGSVYVFKRGVDGLYTQVQKLNPSNAQSRYFGYNLSVDGDDLIVGAYYTNNFTGEVYHYRKNQTIHRIQIAENQTEIDDLNATDVENETVTFSLSGADAALFDINSSTGLLSFITAPDFENPSDGDGDNIYKINIVVTDTNSAAATTAVEIEVTDIHEPHLDPIANINKAEDDAVFVVSLNSTYNGEGSVVYSASSSNTAIATVAISDNNLTITLLENAYGSVTIEVNATANGLIDTQSFTLNIEAQNDAPAIDTTFNNISIAENNGSTQYDINISDIDLDDLNLTVESNDTSIITVTPNWSNPLSSGDYDNQTLDFNLTTVENGTGDVNITVRVTDGVASDTQNFIVTVEESDPSTFFITTWRTTSDGESITIPINSDYSGQYNYKIDCDGDGTFEQKGVTGDGTCTFATAGDHNVSITGTFPAIYDPGVKLVDIVQWGDNQWKSMSHAFSHSRVTTMTATDIPDLSQVTDMNYMFYSTMNFIGNQSFSDWNVSNVTDMNGTFYNAVSFDINITAWDVSNVTNMSLMFARCNFNQPIGNWDVSSVTDMSAMFGENRTFNQPINNWDVSNVTHMQAMFTRAYKFHQPLGDWNVSNVTNMKSMFSDNVDCTATYNQDISRWDVSKVTNMSYMFFCNKAFNQPIGDWNLSSVTNMSNMFKNATSFDQDISGWDVSKVTDMSDMFVSVTLSTTNYDALLVGWNALPPHANVTFHGGNSQYTPNSDASTARANLISSTNWTITDGGVAAVPPELDPIGDVNKTEDDNSFVIELHATDANGDDINYTAKSSNTNIATVSLNENNLTVTLIENANGTVTIEVNATAGGDTDSESFTLNIEAVNDIPTASDVAFTINEDNNKTFTANDFNFTDVENGSLDSIVITTLPTKGSLKLNDVNVTQNQVIANVFIDNLVFTPVANENGSPYATFEFKVSDGEDNSTASYTVTINVTAVNDAPVVISTPVTSINEDLLYEYLPLANDIDGDNINWSVVNKPSWLTFASIETVSALAPSFNAPHDVAVDSNGIIYVADTMNNQIKKIATNGSVTTLAQSESFDTPTGVAVDSNGVVYVVEKFNGKVKKIAIDDSVTLLGQFLNSPMGIAVDSNGVVYVTDSGNGRVAKIAINGSVTIVAPNESFNEPTKIAVDSNGVLYVTDKLDNKIKKITTNDNVTVFAPNESFSFPNGIAVDGSGVVYVADTDNNKIKKITSVTKLIGTPTNDDVGLHDVNLTLSDGSVNVAHNFQITVNNVNDNPTASNVEFTINEDTNKTFTANDFNFSDVDSGDGLEAVIISTLPNKGTLQLNNVNVTQNQAVATANITQLKFIPVANENGSPYTYFGFMVNDGEANSTEYNATIHVNNVGDAPVLDAIGDINKTEDDDGFVVTLNAVDNDGDDISYTVKSSNPNIATVSIT